MTLTLNPNTEAHLNALAQRRGQAPEEIVDALVQREIAEDKPVSSKMPTLPATYISPTAALFSQWAEEDKTDDPEEIARRQREGDELLENLRNHRLSLRIPVGLDEENE